MGGCLNGWMDRWRDGGIEGWTDIDNTFMPKDTYTLNKIMYIFLFTKSNTRLS